MRVNFKEIFRTGEKSGKCRWCGKRAKVRQKFSQTVNPFNKDEDGIPKTYDKIWAELSADIAMWNNKPVVHRKCEAWNPN